MRLDFDLSDPSLTLLHRAGLAGLWMTLKQLETEIPVKNRCGNLDWEPHADEIPSVHRQFSLTWKGNDQEVLEWLLTESFQLDNGIISLRGLNSKTMDIQAKLIVHQGILGTFLQHTSTHKSNGVVEKTLQIEEDTPEIRISYKYLTSYVYQEFASQLCDQKTGNLLNKTINVAGWLNPGAVVRHIAFSSSTSFEEMPQHALALLFAPIACCYFRLESKLRNQKAQFALVVPEVRDLEQYASYRQQPSIRNAGYKSFYASGLGDAALKFLTRKTVANTAHKYGVNHCQVLTLGSVAWSTQQKTRTDVYEVKVGEQVYEKYLQDYLTCCNYFADRVRDWKGTGFYAPSFAKEIITENLAQAKRWYSGLSEKVNSGELFEKLAYDRGGLYQMVQKASWEHEESKQLFVKICHKALGITYGKAGGKAQNSDKEVDFERINTRLRTKISRCKNSQSFREFITDFWCRAGQFKELQDNWQTLMTLIYDEKNWKTPRDLTLLALASYKGKVKKNANDDLEEIDDEFDEEIDDNVF